MIVLIFIKGFLFVKTTDNKNVEIEIDINFKK